MQIYRVELTMFSYCMETMAEACPVWSLVGDLVGRDVSIKTFGTLGFSFAFAFGLVKLCPFHWGGFGGRFAEVSAWVRVPGFSTYVAVGVVVGVGC